MVENIKKNQKYDKWGYMKKIDKSKTVKRSILMKVQNIVLDETPLQKKIKNWRMWIIGFSWYIQNICFGWPLLLKKNLFFAQSYIFWKKANSSIATKLWANLLNEYLKIKIFLVHDTIQWLSFLVHYLNININ